MSRVVRRMFNYFELTSWLIQLYWQKDNSICDWSNGKSSEMNCLLIKHHPAQPSRVLCDKEHVLIFGIQTMTLTNIFGLKSATFNYVDKNNKHICDWSNRKSSDMDSVLMTNIPLPDRPISRVVSNLSTVPSPSIFSSWKVGNYNDFAKKDEHLCDWRTGKSFQMAYCSMSHVDRSTSSFF